MPKKHELWLASCILSITIISMDGFAQDISIDRDLSLAAAPIKSEQDLWAYIHSGQKTAFDALNTANRDAFLSSLEFNEKGLTSFRFDMFENSLSFSEIYSILYLFGLQHITYKLENAASKNDLDRIIDLRLQIQNASTQTSNQIESNNDPNDLSDLANTYRLAISLDHEGYRCESAGSCRKAVNYICTSNC